MYDIGMGSYIEKKPAVLSYDEKTPGMFKV